jgi:dipeptidyl aminopeptidase/acylaminoacyl peptidase
MRMAGDFETNGGFTVWEETIEDALLATELLRADSRIDSERIYILGHSIGGMLAPRIHDAGGNYAGIITWAGSPRFLLDISLTQNIAYMESLEDGAERAEIAAIIENWDEYYGAYLALPDDEARNTLIEGWGGATAYYFKDMYENPAAMFIERIDVPFLVMHPDDDVQVLTDIDFALYQELLADRDNVTFRLYSGLNHLFMPSLGFDITQILDEYRVRANVDEQVLRDIAAWIHSVK